MRGTENYRDSLYIFKNSQCSLRSYDIILWLIFIFPAQMFWFVFKTREEKQICMTSWSMHICPSTGSQAGLGPNAESQTNVTPTVSQAWVAWSPMLARSLSWDHREWHSYFCIPKISVDCATSVLSFCQGKGIADPRNTRSISLACLLVDHCSTPKVPWGSKEYGLLVVVLQILLTSLHWFWDTEEQEGLIH